MSLAKHNRGQRVDWQIETKEYPYKKCADLELNKDYPFLGCFITGDHGFGEGAVIISDGVLYNAPASFIDECKEIMQDAESVEAIKAGKEVFHLEERVSKKNKKTYRVIVFS